MAPNTPAPAPEAPTRPELEYSLRPASEWLPEVEKCIETLAKRREELRRKIQIETRERHQINPAGEPRLSARTARELARTEVLGVDWRRAQEELCHARQRVRSTRRQLASLGLQSLSHQEGSTSWRTWLWHRPRAALQARPLRRRLREANLQRRAALVTLRALRANLARPEVRSRVFGLVESFRLKEERWSQSIQSLQESEQTISGALSEALRLAPRLRDLGTELVAMNRHANPELRLIHPPVPAGPLCAPKPAQKSGRGMRPH